MSKYEEYLAVIWILQLDNSNTLFQQENKDDRQGKTNRIIMHYTKFVGRSTILHTTS